MSEKMISLTVNGETVTVPEGTSILDAAAAAGYEIPTLCYLKDVAEGGKCRMCQVSAEYNGRRYLTISCDECAKDGMKIETHSKEALEARKLNLELLLSRHLHSCFNCDRHPTCRNNQYQYCNYDKNCFTCGARDDCLLRKYSLEAGIVIPAFKNLAKEVPVVEDPYCEYDINRCVRCRRCVATAKKLTGEEIFYVKGRGKDCFIEIGDPALAEKYPEAILKCVENCPTGALKLK